MDEKDARMPSLEDWERHISERSNFEYHAGCVEDVWYDPRTGSFLYRQDNWLGFWAQMGGGQHVKFIPAGAVRVVRSGDTLIFKEDDEGISKIWRSYQRRLGV